MMRVMGWNGSPEPRDSGTRRLASRRGSGVADFHKMTLRLQAGHVQGMNAGYFEAGRHLPELVLFDLTFERQPNATCGEDRKSTRLNSSHMSISYAVFC